MHQRIAMRGPESKEDRAPFSLRAEVASIRDAEMGREIIPGARFANRASPAARVSPNKTRMKTTNTDFDCSSLLSYINVSHHRTKRDT